MGPSVEVQRFEITEVYVPPDAPAQADIVLVHGLNGHPHDTWTSKKNGTFWPADLLPTTLRSAKARILVYGYNADVYAFGDDKSASSDMIHQHAQTLVSTLALERKASEMQDKPIIWVCHSLGGILVKRALSLAKDQNFMGSEDSRSVFISTYGIIFLGTPHTGSDGAKWGHILENMAHTLIPKKFVDTEPHLVRTLKSNNETLQNINLYFLNYYQRFQIYMVHEAVKTDLKGTKAFIVDQISASPQLPGVTYYGIEANHSGMCKFDTKNSPGYLNVSQTIKSWVQDSPNLIVSRWDEERRMRTQQREAQAKELLGLIGVDHPMSVAQPPPAAQSAASLHTYPVDLSNSDHNLSTSMIQSVASIEPEKVSSTFFVKPLGFRPNSLFVGREAELATLHSLLFDDAKRRREGTSAVLVQGIAGGGKTHLVRQYVYDHVDDFPGGVFWVHAKSQAELAAGFWEIAQKVAIKPRPDADTYLRDPEYFITAVTNWFCSTQEWLLVLDGIIFDDSEELRRFIPDSPNSSLIYTSTGKKAEGDHHFMNPQVLKLPVLSARQSQDLFLRELGRKNPTRDEMKQAMELVQQMGFLPLVIHAAARRLKATGEPLHGFVRRYASSPKLRGLDNFNDVVDQLNAAGAIEALNLMYLLCFFSQHIPVELMALGLGALDVPVRAFEPISGTTLNNTFKVLNSVALIDRNEPEDMMTSSQSSKDSRASKSSRELLGDSIDVIRLHSVVQGFFIDSLAHNKELPKWLGRAIQVFCTSFDIANFKIKEKSLSGLVNDYRSYQVHGMKLLTHVKRYEKKAPELEKPRLQLEQRLATIKAEIDRRTPESSQSIAQGDNENGVPISIFDRSSSSSDTGPETPGFFNKYNTKLDPPTWVLDDAVEQFDSPDSIGYPGFDGFPTADMRKHQYPALRTDDDAGYDSEREGGTSMTVVPSQRTLPYPDDSTDDDGWQMVSYRKAKSRPVSPVLHRTTKKQNQNRYRESAGAWRSISSADPRLSMSQAPPKLSDDAVHGVMRSPSRGHSRGRPSGSSIAEAALNDIKKNSPPPGRRGSIIQDRGRSLLATKPLDANNAYKMTRAPSYARAVAKNTPHTISRAYQKPYRSPTRTPSDVSRSETGLIQTSGLTPAMESLNKFSPTSPPGEYFRFHMQGHAQHPATIHERPGASRRYDEQHAESDSMVYQWGSHPDLVPHSYTETPLSYPAYPAPTGNPPQPAVPLPVEYLSSPFSSGFQRKRDLPHDYVAWYSQQYGTMPPEAGIERNLNENLDPFPWSPSNTQSPSINGARTGGHSRPSSIYHPYPAAPQAGSQYVRPNITEVFNPSANRLAGHPPAGYSSQPMSRNPSGNSPATSISGSSRPSRPSSRRHSLAQTDPTPSLSRRDFSPQIGLTSYEAYQRMRQQRQLDESAHAKSMQQLFEPPGPARKRRSPRLGYSGLARETFAAPEPNLNPHAPPFYPPRPSSHSSARTAQPLQNPEFFRPSAIASSSPLMPPHSFQGSPTPSANADTRGRKSPKNGVAAATAAMMSSSTGNVKLAKMLAEHNQNQASSGSRERAGSASQMNMPRAPRSPGEGRESPASSLAGRVTNGNGSAQAIDMKSSGRSSSAAGIKVGRGRVIEFGSFPEPVDMEVARERAERLRELSDMALREREMQMGERMGLAGWEVHERRAVREGLRRDFAAAGRNGNGNGNEAMWRRGWGSPGEEYGGVPGVGVRTMNSENTIPDQEAMGAGLGLGLQFNEGGRGGK